MGPVTHSRPGGMATTVMGQPWLRPAAHPVTGRARSSVTA